MVVYRCNGVYRSLILAGINLERAKESRRQETPRCPALRCCGMLTMAVGAAVARLPGDHAREHVSAQL